MDMVPLTASARDVSAKAGAIRAEGVVPCVLYGNDTDNIPLSCVYNELVGAYKAAGASTIVELDTGSNKVPVLFHSIDFDPVSDRVIHVDFYAVDLKKEIEAKIPIQFEGEAPAAKDLGGVLVTTLDHVTVKCLPTKLPHSLSVDLSSLENFGDSVTVEAITAPEGVEIIQGTDTVLAIVQEPRKEEEIKPAEEEEGAEGEAAEGETSAEAKEGEATEGEGEKKEEGEGEKKE